MARGIDMSSWTILTSLKSNLADYIENQEPNFHTIIELRQENDTILSQRSDIAQFRLGIYEQSNAVDFTVEGGKAYEGTQSYEIALFCRVDRKDVSSESIEKNVMRMKDIIVSWLYQLDVSTVTSDGLQSLTYTNNTAPDRQNDYTSLVIDLEAFRNLPSST